MGSLYTNLYVIVLAWNHKEDTREALCSFLESENANFRIVVVDNASTDGTVEMVKSEFPSVEIITSHVNLGVSGGYNLGIQYAMDHGANFVLIANNDILVHPKMIAHLIESQKENPSIGISMPKIYHFYGDQNRYWCTGGYWRKCPPTIKMMNSNRKENDVRELPEFLDFAPSCVLLLNKLLINAIGLFDTNYFFYFDDWDYSIRARKSGFKIALVQESKMWHKVSISTQKSENPQIWWEHMGWSAALFAKKHLSSPVQVIFLSWMIVREVMKFKFRRSKGILKGILSLKNNNQTVECPR